MSEHDDTSRARLIDGNAVGARVRAGLTAEVAALLSGGLSPPGLGVILVGDDPASQSYVRSKELSVQRGRGVVRNHPSAGQHFTS